MSAGDAGRLGLNAIDKVLAQKPHKDDHSLAEATKQLCAWRDDLIAQRDRSRSAQDAQRLEHLNAVINIVIATHFPLGEVPWEELGKAKGWLANLLDGQPVAG